MEEIEKDFGIKARPMEQRVLTNTLKTASRTKCANTSINIELDEHQSTEADQLLLAYGYYKVAAIKTMNDLHGSDFVDTPEQLIISYQNRNY